ncbi:hypothetical protein N8017_05090, partial [Crocinitomicaceae bacterium]|nr:hypothetical protein [Crocinitomicaceae bacterium]
PKKNRKLVLVLLFALTLISGLSYVLFKRGNEPLKKEVQVIENDSAGSEEEIIADEKDASETKTTLIDQPVLGDYVQGGFVFHVEDDYFLVSGIEDLSHDSPWSSKNIRIGNTQKELGTGNANTNAIIKAAKPPKTKSLEKI